MNNYDDIIYLSRPISNHPKLSIASRAAQFAPFSALTGYDEQIDDASKVTVKKIKLDDNLKESLNQKLNFLYKNIKDHPDVTITYFVKDVKMDEGYYITVKGKITKLDVLAKWIILDNNLKIKMDDLLSINSSIFDTKVM